MAQAGLHGLAAVAVRRWVPAARGLTLGLFIGNMFPDLDNVAVAAATITGGETEGLHRTFTHSIFTIVAVIVIFFILGRLTGRATLTNFGIGLGGGILMHGLFDMIVWFNGVALIWPLGDEFNLWQNVAAPDWWMSLMMPAEFLFFGLYLLALERMGAGPGLRRWTYLELGLFVVFTILVYAAPDAFTIPYGAVYLLSLFLVLGLTWQQRNVIESKPAMMMAAPAD